MAMYGTAASISKLLRAHEPERCWRPAAASGARAESRARSKSARSDDGRVPRRSRGVGQQFLQE